MEREPPALRLRAFGPLEIVAPLGGDVASVVSQPKRVGVLIHLAVARPRGFLTRDALVAMFWPEIDDARARAQLNKVVHHLRRTFGPSILLRRGNGDLSLNWRRVRCDVTSFERAIDRGDWRRALALYRGDLMPAFHVGGAPAFTEWLDDRRAHFRRLAVRAALQSMTTASELGEHHAALQHAQRALDIDWTDEHGVRGVLALLDRTGRRAAAAQVYERFQKRLEDELGVQPSPETSELAAVVRARSATVAMPLVLADERGSVPAEPLTSVPPSRRPWRAVRWRWVLGGMAALLVAAAPIIRRSSASKPDAHRRVLVLPLAVYGSPELSYLREGVMVTLASALDGISDLASVDPRLGSTVVPATDTLARLDDARRVAGRTSAEYYVLGDVVQAGPRIRILARLFAAGGSRPIVDAIQEGEPSQLFELVDEIARKLVAGIGSTAARQSASGTRSMPALRAYLEGENQLRDGRFTEAVERFAAAIAEDSTYALAHWRLASAADWAGREDLARTASAAATRHGNRLTVTGRLHVRALNGYLTGRFTDAAKIYADLLAQTPDDVEAWQYLAEIQYHYGYRIGEPLEASAAAWRRLLELQPGNAAAALHMQTIAARAADRAAYERYAEQLQMHRIDAARELQVRTIRAFAFQGAAERRALIEDLSELARPSLIQAAVRVATVGREFDLNEVFFGRRGPSFGTSPGDATLYSWIARFDAAAGRVNRALAVLDTATAIDPVEAVETTAMILSLPHIPFDSARYRATLRDLSTRVRAQTLSGLPADVEHAFLAGMLAVRARDSIEVKTHLARLAAAEVPDTTRRVRIAMLVKQLSAERFAADGDARSALERLGPPSYDPQLAGALGHYLRMRERLLRAACHQTLGNVEEALRWYATFPESFAGDAPSYVPVLLRRAALHAARGAIDQAAKDRSLAAHLWRDADASLRSTVR